MFDGSVCLDFDGIICDVAGTIALVTQETQVPQKCLVGEVFFCPSELENVEQRG